MLSAFDDATSVQVRKVRLRPRALCPHCSKVVTGKRHRFVCTAKPAKVAARHCQDCGDPVRGRSWRCEPCKVVRRYDYRDKDQPAQMVRHAIWLQTESGKASVIRGRRKFASLNPEKLRKWEKTRDWERRRAYLKAYYRANKGKWKGYAASRAATYPTASDSGIACVGKSP